jgi:putative restriction endonuclease
MVTADSWLHKLSKLRVDRASGDPAPHKPLLLLAILERAERGQLPPRTLPLTPEMAFQFYTYWAVVAHRRRQRPDIRLPFHHLQGDGVWTVLDDSGQPSNDSRRSKFAVMPTDFVNFVNDPISRDHARRLIIAKYFQPHERLALYSIFGLPVPTDDQINRDASYRGTADAEKRGREARFRLCVIPAYNYTCALTGYRLTTITAGSIVDAAHIHQFADSRNNEPGNGLALCKNAHWQFDCGLWTASNDFRVIVATSKFSESCPDGRLLSDYHGQLLRLPADKSLWPDVVHLAWHRKHRFQGEI